MLAAMNGHVPAVKLLLDMGSDINAQIETNRNTALTLACFQGRAEVVSLLLDRKANVEHRAKVRSLDPSGKDTEFYYAAMTNEFADTVTSRRLASLL